MQVIPYPPGTHTSVRLVLLRRPPLPPPLFPPSLQPRPCPPLVLLCWLSRLFLIALGYLEPGRLAALLSVLPGCCRGNDVRKDDDAYPNVVFLSLPLGKAPCNRRVGQESPRAHPSPCFPTPTHAPPLDSHPNSSFPALPPPPSSSLVLDDRLVIGSRC